jgi:hypothetical protein
MKRVLLLLAVVVFAFPAFADSITFYGSQARGRYVNGGALSSENTFAFNVTGRTGSSTNNNIQTGGSLSANWTGSVLNGAHSQQLNIVSGGNSKGYRYTYGNVGRGNATTPVPEPETLGLLGTGLFVIGGLVRRKLKVDNLPTSSDVNSSENGPLLDVMTSLGSPLNQSSTVANGVPVFTSPASDSAIATEVEAL